MLKKLSTLIATVFQKPLLEEPSSQTEAGNMNASPTSDTKENILKLIISPSEKYEETLTTVNDNSPLLATLARVIDDSLDDVFIQRFAKYINYTGFNRRVFGIQTCERYACELSALFHPISETVCVEDVKYTRFEINISFLERDKLSKKDRVVQYVARYIVRHGTENDTEVLECRLYAKPYNGHVYHRFISDAATLMDIFYNSTCDTFEKEQIDPTKKAVVVPLKK